MSAQRGSLLLPICATAPCHSSLLEKNTNSTWLTFICVFWKLLHSLLSPLNFQFVCWTVPSVVSCSFFSQQGFLLEKCQRAWSFILNAAEVSSRLFRPKSPTKLIIYINTNHLYYDHPLYQCFFTSECVLSCLIPCWHDHSDNLRVHFLNLFWQTHPEPLLHWQGF